MQPWRTCSKFAAKFLREPGSALAVVSWSLAHRWSGSCSLTGKLLPPFSLPHPDGVVQAFVRLWTEYNLLGNVFTSWWRIAQAFFWCAVVAIPLGLLMGSFGWLHDLVNPRRRAHAVHADHRVSSRFHRSVRDGRNR